MWEYLFDSWEHNCKSLGEGGWELVNVLQTNIHYPEQLTFIYKRRKEIEIEIEPIHLK